MERVVVVACEESWGRDRQGMSGGRGIWTYLGKGYGDILCPSMTTLEYLMYITCESW